MLYSQMIKKDNEGTASRKIALYRTFLQCGVRTWEQVIKALEICGHGEIAVEVKMKLLSYRKLFAIVHVRTIESLFIECPAYSKCRHIRQTQLHMLRMLCNTFITTVAIILYW